MANFAVVENNIVSNIIIADSLEIAKQVTGAECFEYTDDNPINVGQHYDKNSGLFFNPPIQYNYIPDASSI